LEAIVKGRAMDDKLNWEVNYSFIQPWDSPDGQADHFLDYEQTQPKHKINLALDYTTGAWEFNTDVHFVTGSDNYTATVGDFKNARRATTLDDYVTLNARIGYKPFEMTTLAFEGYNLADEHYERPALNVTNGVGGGNKIGRTVLFHLQQQF
jgi:outer membrane receptor protein involved in Fe transport